MRLRPWCVRVRASTSSCRCYNEQRALPGSIRRLHDYLSAELPFDWRIVIADNASTDETAAHRRRARRATCRRRRGAAADAEGPRPRAAGRLVGERRRRRSATWTSTCRPTCARCCRWSRRCVSGPQRRRDRDAAGAAARRSCAGRSASSSRAPTTGSCASRWRARFSDAQCGFKAVRARRRAAAAAAGPRRGLVLRHRAARARAARRAADPRGAGRLGRRPRLARGHRAHGASTTCAGIARLLATARLTRFLAVGVCSTLAYALLYLAAARRRSAPAGANALALAVTAVANTQANRRFTFGVRGRDGPGAPARRWARSSTC